MVKCKFCKEDVDKTLVIQKVLDGQKSKSNFCSSEHLYKFEKKIQDDLLEKERKVILRQQKAEEKARKQEETRKFNELDLYIAIEILGNEKGQIVNPYLKSRVKKLAKHYDYEVIKMAFEYVKSDLHYYLRNKEFTDETHKINYIMVIIERNINDTYKIWKRKKELALKQENSPVIQEDVMEVIESTPIRKTETRNIIAFLDEEDY